MIFCMVLALTKTEAPEGIPENITPAHHIDPYNSMLPRTLLSY